MKKCYTCGQSELFGKLKKFIIPRRLEIDLLEINKEYLICLSCEVNLSNTIFTYMENMKLHFKNES